MFFKVGDPPSTMHGGMNPGSGRGTVLSSAACTIRSRGSSSISLVSSPSTTRRALKRRTITGWAFSPVFSSVRVISETR